MADFDILRTALEDHIKNNRVEESFACINAIAEIIKTAEAIPAKKDEDQFNALIANIIDVIWVFDVETMQISYISPSIKRLCGYSAEEIMDHPESNNFSSALNNSLHEVFQDRLKFFLEDPNNSEIYIDEIELPMKGGGSIWTEAMSSFSINSKSHRTELIGASRDYTDRKNARIALKKARERYKILSDLSIEGLIIHEEGKIIDANPAVERMLGEDLDIILGASIFDYIHPDYTAMVKEKIATNAIGKYEIVLLRKDSTIITAEIEANFYKLNDKLLRVAVIRDITAQKAVEEKMRKFTYAVTQSPSAIVITNLTGRIEYVNPHFTIITGYSSEEAIGQNPRILKSGLIANDVYKDLWLTITSGNTWKGELLNKRKDGSLFWERAIIAPIKNEQGKTTNFIAVKEDITFKKEAEQALIQSKEELKQANATKDKFFSIIAHDLKNPFHIILGFSDLLLLNHKEYDLETRESVIKTIYDMGLKTFNLLENLLAWSKTQTGILAYHPNEIDMHLLVKDCVSLFKENAETKNIQMITTIEDDYVAFADRDMIATVLRNLIINGIKFTPRGGAVSIIGTKTSDHFIQMEIKDTGVGIIAEKVPHIFDIDRNWSEAGTEEESGTGLGLFLCKEFVHKNGGEIWLESEVAKGTSFYFTVPMNP